MPRWLQPLAQLRISVVRNGSQTVIGLNGELDMSTVAILDSALSELELELPPTVVLDLQELRFIDSSGLHGFVDAEHRIRSQGSRLVLARGSDYVRRLLEMTQIDSLFHFVDPRTPFAEPHLIAGG